MLLVTTIIYFVLYNEPASASISDVQKLGTSSTEFGLNLYNELRKDTSVKNIFLSPASISLVLSMLLLGAKGIAYFKGKTLKQALPKRLRLVWIKLKNNHKFFSMWLHINFNILFDLNR